LRSFSAACSAGVCSYPAADVTCVNGCSMGACIACQAGGACNTNPSRCRQGRLECPNGANSTPVCVDGANAADGTDCGAAVFSGACRYLGCSNSGTRSGTIATCAAGACTGSRTVSMLDPACARDSNGSDCGSEPACTTGGNICRCEYAVRRTCFSESCTEETVEYTCGLCMGQTCLPQ
jgi:hypothetical protein